jgi:1-acyl-sn-glycerol-3-phosphate acyltransferase
VFRTTSVGHEAAVTSDRRIANPLRTAARHLPGPLGGFAEVWAGVLHDLTDPGPLLHGSSVEAWDPEYIERTLPLLHQAFFAYFRGEVRGLENIPDGPALLVGNHSGGLLIADTFLFATAFYHHFGPQHRFHQLAHQVVARTPLLGSLRRYGTLNASHDDARKAFDLGAPVLVYPGGDWETFRPSWRGGEADLAGRRGFLRLALEAGVPVVPVVSLGGQENGLFLTRGERLAEVTGFAKLTRIKVLPVTVGPPFGVTIMDLPFRWPLPSKTTVQVLPPLDATDLGFSPRRTRGATAQDIAAADLDAAYDLVSRRIQEQLDALSAERDLPLIG